jgi:phenylacetic acid degradation operon negative regulatory protein
MKPKGPNARKLILGLLLATDGAPLNVRDAITACALFDITENNVRVTLVRLSADGLIRASGRGAYVMGPRAEGLTAAVSQWRIAEQRVVAWGGRYVLVHTGPLSRSDRQTVQRRERALHLFGLRELERGLFVRPDNLRGGVADLRERLVSVGLEAEAAVFGADGFDHAREARIGGLWDGAALSRSYARQHAELMAWLERSALLDDDVAARESYLLGGEAIRQVVFDPWLPAELVDTVARTQFVATVRRFDAAGKAIWRGVSGGRAFMPLADPG